MTAVWTNNQLQDLFSYFSDPQVVNTIMNET